MGYQKPTYRKKIRVLRGGLAEWQQQNTDKDPGPPICDDVFCGTGGNIDSGSLPENDIYFFHPDHLGSTSYITNIAGETVQFNSYLPFGESFVSQQRTSSISAYLFNSKEKDPETGLYYYGARYYNSKTSVWLSVDPIALYDPINEVEHYLDGQHNGGYFNPANLSVYGYTYQNPVLYVDPNGKQSYFNGLPSSVFNTGRSLENTFKPSRINISLPSFGKKYSTVDNTIQAVRHYYGGGGSSVKLGPETQAGIKNHPKVQSAINNLKTGKTIAPAEPISKTGNGIPINFEGVSYHLGDMGLNYETKCNASTCTTNFTVDDSGFVDPNDITANLLGMDDNMGPDNELGGTPYDYEPVQWSETYDNPGYSVDKNGTPSIKKSDNKPVFNELCTVCKE